jgi:hypothetical protein
MLLQLVCMEFSDLICFRKHKNDLLKIFVHVVIHVLSWWLLESYFGIINWFVVGFIGRMVQIFSWVLGIIVTSYVPNSTSTNATSQFHRVINRRVTADGRCNTRECGGKTSVSSQHPAAFGCISYTDAAIFSCSISSIKVEHNNENKWNSQ